MSLDILLFLEASKPDMGISVFSENITHNLNVMADKAGIYKCMWRPDENAIERAEQMIEPLRAGIAKLEADPAYFKQFNPINGWGTYEQLLGFARDLLLQCEAWPNARVYANR